MPIRYTCRLIVVDAPEGKLRIKYGYLGDGRRKGRCILIINGPAIVEPPARDMTEEEFKRWQFDFTCGTGFSFAFESCPIEAPLVEAKKTIEDEIPKDSVQWKLVVAMNEHGGRTLGIQLTNRWNQPIPKFTLSTVWKANAPQPAAGIPAEFGAELAGGSESVFHRLTPIGLDTLPPNIMIPFFYDPDFLKPLRSRVAVISPDLHWISLNTAGYEFDRIPGSAIAEFLDTLDEDVAA